MSEQFLGGLDFDEFDHLIENYLARSEPDAISFEVFEELANESNQPPLKIELTGIVKDGTLQLRMAEPANVPLQVQHNEILVNNLQLVIQLEEEQ